MQNIHCFILVSMLKYKNKFFEKAVIFVAKNKKIVRYRKPFHLNIGVIIFGIIFIYMMFYVFTYFTSTHTSVYEVVQGTIAINNTYTGLALRSEEIISAESNGSINYYVKEASKVGANDLIYSVDTDGFISKQINQANEDSSILTTENLKEIQNRISEYIKEYDANSFYNVYTFEKDLNAEVSEALSMNALENISKDILWSEGNSTFHRGNAAKDGVAVYYTDGFENITVDSFTKEMFDEETYTKVNLKDRETVSYGEPAYKLITSEHWNLIVPITEDTKRQLQNASTVRIKFKKDNTVLRATFSLVEKEGFPYLNVEMNNSMIRFATDRFVEIELLFDEETGLKIPNSAIASKEFYIVPMEYFQKGNNSDDLGIVIRKKDDKGNVTDTFITPNIYFATEYGYYVDSEEISAGDTVLKPNSSETHNIHETGKLEGVYCINKGFAVFKQIDIIYQNNEYSIIRSGTEYGISLYDHIALDGTTITENAII